MTDSISNTTYLSGAGNVNIWAGPGWVHPEQSEADFSGTEADTQQIVNFRLFNYECNAPTHVYGHACGSKGTPPNASLNSLGHDSLIWEVDSWDSQFYLSVDTNVNQTSQDGFDATVLPHRCGRDQAR